MFTSWRGGGTTPTTTQYTRTNMVGARRLCGGALPAFEEGKATPGISHRQEPG